MRTDDRAPTIRSGRRRPWSAGIHAWAALLGLAACAGHPAGDEAMSRLKLAAAAMAGLLAVSAGTTALAAPVVVAFRGFASGTTCEGFVSLTIDAASSTTRERIDDLARAGWARSSRAVKMTFRLSGNARSRCSAAAAPVRCDARRQNTLVAIKAASSTNTRRPNDPSPAAIRSALINADAAALTAPAQRTYMPCAQRLDIDKAPVDRFRRL